jgi:hypothetical protein
MFRIRVILHRLFDGTPVKPIMLGKQLVFATHNGEFTISSHIIVADVITCKAITMQQRTQHHCGNRCVDPFCENDKREIREEKKKDYFFYLIKKKHQAGRFSHEKRN